MVSFFIVIFVSRNKNNNNYENKNRCYKIRACRRNILGQHYESSYNHNYFYSPVLKDVIYEECDDDEHFQYWRLNGYSTQYLGDYYGVGGIFKDENGIVELDN